MREFKETISGGGKDEELDVVALHTAVLADEDRTQISR